MNIVFAGGGTGGHLYPALAIANGLKKLAAKAVVPLRISFMGNADRLEATIVPRAGYPLFCIPSRPLQRQLSLDTFGTIVINVYGVARAIRGLRKARPNVVIATGGYVSFPVVAAARLLCALKISRAHIALLEINAYPGLTNRLLAPLVDEVWGAFETAASFFGSKFYRTGIPVRAGLNDADRTEAFTRFELDPRKKTILVMGGSQGARSINQAVVDLVTYRNLPDNWQILHVTGERDFQWVKAQERDAAQGNIVRLVSYLHDLAAAYAAADIVVSRAGASTLGELAFTGTPSVLVPYPFAAEKHQSANADVFARSGAARTIEDGTLSGDVLFHVIADCLAPETLRSMRAAANALSPPDPIDKILLRIAALARRG
ncbi:MAG: undecaprenyldiphospho-muramoylpentapeptide beta-N-acetylglucosaminyltransferase [Candidatus Eremiobacteraeota bacterium]|nr:undecaprenyldiphospho-muramoylpentapeptide beta-N-acetylglucosaminyltransferase [Candidatus Eremiobacteraeota bacterium]